MQQLFLYHALIFKYLVIVCSGNCLNVPLSLQSHSDHVYKDEILKSSTDKYLKFIQIKPVLMNEFPPQYITD